MHPAGLREQSGRVGKRAAVPLLKGTIPRAGKGD